MTNQGISEAVFGGNQVVGPDPRPHLPNAFHTFSLGEEWDGKAIGWELFVNDLSGGLGNVSGGIRESMALESSTLDHRFRGSIMLPSLTTMQDSAADLGQKSIRHINHFATTAIGYGQTANNALWKTTSNSNAALTALTYTPTSDITGLHPIIIGGVSTAERIAVCRSTDAIQILSDLAATPTVDGTMHASTDNSYGLITTPLPHDSGGFYILIYSSNNIYTLNTAAAIGDAPTSAQSNVPNGGGALGVKAPIGWPLSAWWVWPTATLANQLFRGSTPFARLIRTNLQGTDVQEVKFPGGKLYAVAEWRDGFVGSTGLDSTGNFARPGVFYWDGQTFEKLAWMTERPRPTSTEVFIDYRIYGFYVRGDDLFMEVGNFHSGTASDFRHIEWYDPYTKRFYQVTADVQDGAYEQTTARSIGSLPVSDLTGFFYTAQDQSGGTNTFFHRALVWDSHTNPFYLLGTGGLGPNAGSTHTFEAAGTSTSADLILPGIERAPKVLTEAVYLGGWRDTTAGSSAKIDVAINSSSLPYLPTFTTPVTVTFSDVDRVEKNRRKFRDNVDAFIKLKFRLTLTRRSAGTGHTPNGLPFILRGIAFLDGVVRKPQDVLGKAWNDEPD